MSISKHSFRRLAFPSVALAILSASAPAMAQQAEATDGGVTLDDIIVTATKRQESAQTVPIAITAFSGETLAALGVVTPVDLANQTPNFKIKSEFGVQPIVFMRGIGNTNFFATSINPVGMYLDGVYMGPNFAQGLQLYDLERVEILRGPQGHLYGRNTTGGLVSFITRRPSASAGLNGQARIQVGDFGQRFIEAAVGAPLSSNAAFRLAVQHDENDGMFTNINPAFDKDAGGRNLDAVRLSFAVDAGNGVDLFLSGRYGKSQSQNIGTKPGFFACPPGAIVGGFRQGCTDVFGYGLKDAPGYHEVDYGSVDFENVETYGASLEANIALGENYTFTSLTSADSAKMRRQFDADGSRAALVDSSFAADSDFYSQELRLTSDLPGPFNWLVGANYYREDIDSHSFFNIADATFALGSGLDQEIRQKTRTAGVFGEVTYKFTEDLTLRAGARWTSDKRSATIESFVANATGMFNSSAAPAFVIPALPAGGFISESDARASQLAQLIPLTALSKTARRVSGRVSLDYELAPNQLVFASVSRGFKGGEVNGGAQLSPAEVSLTKPETVMSYELGYKGRPIPGLLRLNVTGFLMKVSDQQVLINAGALFSTLANAASSETKGVEVEGVLTPGGGFSANFGVAYLDGRFKSFKDVLAGVDRSGNRLPEAPKWNLSGLVRYETPLANGTASAQLDATWNSSRFFTIENGAAQRQAAYAVVNGSIGYAFGPDEKFAVRVFVKNLLDKDYLVSGFALNTFGLNAFQPGQPRSFGVSISGKF